MNDLKLLEDNYWRQIFALLGSIMMTIGTLTYELYSNIYITLIFLLFMIILSFSPKLFSKSIKNKTERWSNQNKNLATTVRDLFHGALLFKRYRSIKGFSNRLNYSIKGMEKSNAQMKNQIALSNNLINFLFFAFSYIPIGIGVYFTVSGKIMLSQFVAIQYSSSWILNKFNSVMNNWNTINSTKDIRKRVMQVDSNKSLKENSDSNFPIRFKELTIKNLNFAFNNKVVLDNINLKMKKGDKILINGESGVGKSTLIQLILKELKSIKGSILINNDNYSKSDAYSLFGIVGQSPVIFEDTIKNNITLGEKVDNTLVYDALIRAGLEGFANKDSINMSINENGNNLSNGQLKRIEIARSLFFNHHFLLIDEGTASLDVKISKVIHESLLDDDDLTVIEVDHHIPKSILNMYDKRYNLKPNGLFDIS